MKQPKVGVDQGWLRGLCNACVQELAAIRCRSTPAARQLLLLLNGLKVIDDRAHVLSREDELRHVRMAG
jgi:hypothetical protein